MRAILRITLFLIAVSMASFASGSQLDKADAYYQEGNFREALSIYLKPKYQNIAKVQVRLGNIYLQPGFMNEKKSTEWFKKAAEQGDPNGMLNLGLAYLEGTGIKKNYTQAVELVQKALDKDLSAAMSAMGYMYRNGLGVQKDEKEAAQWYLKAANAGDITGVCNLAGIVMHSDVVEKNYEQAHYLLDACLQHEPNNNCCLNRMAELYSGGWGVERDAQKAHALRQQAAVHGTGVTLYMLGRDFDYGIGVEKDPKAAMDWYLKAAAKDNAKAMYRLYEVYEYGKLEQAVDKAKAREWKAKAEKAMKEQGLSRNVRVDDFRLKLEDEQ